MAAGARWRLRRSDIQALCGECDSSYVFNRRRWRAGGSTRRRRENRGQAEEDDRARQRTRQPKTNCVVQQKQAGPPKLISSEQRLSASLGRRSKIFCFHKIITKMQGPATLSHLRHP